MSKLFVTSDIHGFFTLFKETLDKSGFDKNNPDHYLIVCGDYFDRGREPWEVMQYLQSLSRVILIRGNHEGLLEDMCRRGFPFAHDLSNGTHSTASKLLMGARKPLFIEETLSVIKPFFDKMVNYFETKNYIFVHSWIPVIVKDNLPRHYTIDRNFEFNPDWRNASQKDWENAMWGNPFAQAAQGLFPDKTIVFGHWHASAGRTDRSEFGEDACFDPYIGEGYDINGSKCSYIAVDACTAYSNQVNVLVLEDDLLNKDG